MSRHWSDPKERPKILNEAAERRVVTDAIPLAANSRKHGNPRVFIGKFVRMMLDKDEEAIKEEIPRFINEELEALRASVELLELQQVLAEREEASYDHKISNIQQEIKEIEADIEAKKVELEESKRWRALQLQHEQLRKALVRLPSREASAAEAARAAADVAELQRENAALESAIALRKKQFTQLALVLRDLQASAREDPVEAARAAASADGGTAASGDAASGKTTPMETD